MGIGNIGWTEFIVILGLVLVFFGPQRLPELAATLGKGLREFRKALNEVKTEISAAGDESRIHPNPAAPERAVKIIDETTAPETKEPDSDAELSGS